MLYGEDRMWSQCPIRNSTFPSPAWAAHRLPLSEYHPKECESAQGGTGRRSVPASGRGKTQLAVWAMVIGLARDTTYQRHWNETSLFSRSAMVGNTWILRPPMVCYGA